MRSGLTEWELPLPKKFLFEVVVANGDKIASNTGVRVFLQGDYLEIDFYLLPLGGFEAVLGAQWLCTLGPILWDFGQLLMKFILGGQAVELKGLASLRNQLVEGEQFAKEIRKSKAGLVLHMFSVQLGVTQSEEEITDS